jgi:hypothetical protein
MGSLGMPPIANGGLIAQVAKLEERMDTVEEYIGNSKAFQKTMADFVSRSDERAKHRIEQEAGEKETRDRLDKRRATIHFALLTALLSLIVGLALAAVNWAMNFEKRHHVSDKTEIQSEQHPKTDSGLPPAYEAR